MVLETVLQIIQIILSVSLVASVVLQTGGGGLGSLFGGGDGGGVSRTRRGLEKTLFQITIALSALFIINAILQLLVA